MTRTSKGTRLGCQCHGFMVIEVMLVSVLMGVLVLLLSGAWSGLGRPSTDAAARCRMAQEANLALQSLACDFHGSLAGEVTGRKQAGRLVGRLLVGGSQLWLCFDGEPTNGVADWGSPDTVIVYEVQANHLVRSDHRLGTVFNVAANAEQMRLTEQGDGVKIELTLRYRDIARTYTIVAKDP